MLYFLHFIILWLAEYHFSTFIVDLIISGSFLFCICWTLFNWVKERNSWKRDFGI